MPPYEKTVYLLVLSRVQNEADAEDVVQEAFLKAFRYLASFRAESKFSTWVISIALNEAKSRIRKRAAVKVDTLDADPEEEGHVSPALLRDWREIPSEALERREVLQILQKAVAELPTIYREIFLLRDVEELNTNEAAETLGISVALVKVRLHRARMMLQKTLVPQLKQTSPKRRWLPWL